MTEQESAVNFTTSQHIRKVQGNLFIFITHLLNRAEHHDDSKLVEPELKYFAEHTHRLAGLTFGTEEYKQSLKDIQPALKHHYAHNRHHPEHFKNGVNGMNLIDLCEMLCDWRASADRQDDGNVRQSLSVCADRFGLSPQLVEILENTLELID